MGSTTKVETPAMPQEQKDLMSQQSAMLQQMQGQTAAQSKTQQLLAPYLYSGLGLSPQYDASGNITGFSQQPMTEAQQLAQDVQTQALQRTKQYLAGEGPIDPQTEAQFLQDQQALSSTMARQLGTDWQSSTAGSKAWTDLMARQDQTRTALRTGTMSTYQQMGLSQSQENSRLAQLGLSNLMGVTDYPFSTANQYGQLAGLYGQATQPYTQQQQMGLQATLGNAQQGNALGSILGGIGGMAIGSFAGGAGAGIGGSLGKSLGTMLFA